MYYLIREIKKQEYNLLDDFLYEAIFIPEGVEVPSKEITNQPDLQIYIADFGKQNDNCLVAECNGKIVGAVWTRIINDYGHIDNETPSLAISLFKEYRSLGIGTALMNRMIELLKSKGYKRVSLSVQKENYAYNLYKKVGFEIIKENDEDFIMVKQL
ncbi:MAG TPA: GNAT family N-acetyltransferase [Ruminococcus sp.]|nr:GNAT family N-acetyltransferase [Ruminococcus sp.]